jgi:hypothetical protein
LLPKDQTPARVSQAPLQGTSQWADIDREPLQDINILLKPGRYSEFHLFLCKYSTYIFALGLASRNWWVWSVVYLISILAVAHIFHSYSFRSLSDLSDYHCHYHIIYTPLSERAHAHFTVGISQDQVLFWGWGLGGRSDFIIISYFAIFPGLWFPSGVILSGITICFPATSVIPSSYTLCRAAGWNWTGAIESVSHTVLYIISNSPRLVVL